VCYTFAPASFPSAVRYRIRCNRLVDCRFLTLSARRATSNRARGMIGYNPALFSIPRTHFAMIGMSLYSHCLIIIFIRCNSCIFADDGLIGFRTRRLSVERIPPPKCPCRRAAGTLTITVTPTPGLNHNLPKSNQLFCGPYSTYSRNFVRFYP